MPVAGTNDLVLMGIQDILATLQTPQHEGSVPLITSRMHDALQELGTILANIYHTPKPTLPMQPTLETIQPLRLEKAHPTMVSTPTPNPPSLRVAPGNPHVIEAKTNNDPSAHEKPGSPALRVTPNGTHIIPNDGDSKGSTAAPSFPQPAITSRQLADTPTLALMHAASYNSITKKCPRDNKPPSTH